MVLLCGEDDDKVQNAAAGALAMLTAAHSKLCLKMTHVVRAGAGSRKGWSGCRGSPPRAQCLVLLGGCQTLWEPFPALWMSVLTT